MIIISHRGFWEKSEEKNTKIAFKKAFEMGFGVETDIRDYAGELVISHDIADKYSLRLEDFFELYNNYNDDLILALNIKADGLQDKLKYLLNHFAISSYFLFDMSMPDALVSKNTGLTIFTRQSEYETKPYLYDNANGIWLDEFQTHWIDKDVINSHIKNNKKICIVSPELHGRNYKKEWNDYKKVETNFNIDNMMICTDYPQDAKRFFNNEKN